MRSSYKYPQVDSVSQITCRSCRKGPVHDNPRPQSKRASMKSLERHRSNIYFKLAETLPQLDDFDEYLLKRDRKNTKKTKNLTRQVKALKGRLEHCEQYIEHIGMENRHLKKSLKLLQTSRTRISGRSADLRDDLLTYSSKDQTEDDAEITQKLAVFQRQQKVEHRTSRNHVKYPILASQQQFRNQLPASQQKLNLSKKISNSKQLLTCLYYDGNEYQLITPQQKSESLSKQSSIQQGKQKQEVRLKQRQVNSFMEESSQAEKTIKYSDMARNNSEAIQELTAQLDYLVLQQSKVNNGPEKKRIRNRMQDLSNKITTMQVEDNELDEYLLEN